MFPWIGSFEGAQVRKKLHNDHLDLRVHSVQFVGGQPFMSLVHEFLSEKWKKTISIW
jgi:hypothetical protein